MENLIRFWIAVCTEFALVIILMCAYADFIKEMVEKVITKIRFYFRVKKMLKEGKWIQIGDKVYKLVKNTHIEEV